MTSYKTTTMLLVAWAAASTGKKVAVIAATPVEIDRMIALLHKHVDELKDAKFETESYRVTFRNGGRIEFFSMDHPLLDFDQKKVYGCRFDEPLFVDHYADECQGLI